MNKLNPRHRQLNCCVCERKLYGRSDKVFCDISCKNKFHSEERKHNKTVFSETIKILSKNYRILTSFKGNDANKFLISTLELKRRGFQFDVITGFESNKYGNRMKVYEFSWHYSKNHNITVYYDQSQSTISPFVYRRWEIHYERLQT